MKYPIADFAALWALALAATSMLMPALTLAIAAPADKPSAQQFALENYELAGAGATIRVDWRQRHHDRRLQSGGVRKMVHHQFHRHHAQGRTHYNGVDFDAVPTAGGTLCTNGRWRALDGSATGTTPFRVFIKDGCDAPLAMRT